MVPELARLYCDQLPGDPLGNKKSRAEKSSSRGIAES